jgi:hypothetical protein
MSTRLIGCFLQQSPSSAQQLNIFSGSCATDVGWMTQTAFNMPIYQLQGRPSGVGKTSLPLFQWWEVVRRGRGEIIFASEGIPNIKKEGINKKTKNSDKQESTNG